jgi:hypothetical protein
MDETPEQQREEQEKIGFASYEKVAPHYDTTGADEEVDGCHCFRCEDSDVKDVEFGESVKKEARVSALRTSLGTAGYKSIWQTETINHAGDRTVISSWVPNEVPGHGETPKAYKSSIYEDTILVERYEGENGIYPGQYCGSSTYVHGVDPKLRRVVVELEDCDDEIPEWHKASDAVEATAGEGEHYTAYVDYCPGCGQFYVLAESVCGGCGTPRKQI